MCHTDNLGVLLRASASVRIERFPVFYVGIGAWSFLRGASAQLRVRVLCEFRVVSGRQVRAFSESCDKVRQSADLEAPIGKLQLDFVDRNCVKPVHGEWNFCLARAEAGRKGEHMPIPGHIKR